MFEIKYNFEFFCFPIWIKEISNDADLIFKNISIDELPISSDLKEQIKSLDLIYQSTYNDEYPPEPIEMSLEDGNNFCMEVIKSASKLKESLPYNYKLLFDFSYWRNRIKENIQMGSMNKIIHNENVDSLNQTKINCTIISRGHMRINYGDMSVTITGELISNPPTFYADIIALNIWDTPNFKKITEEEKKDIIDYITNRSLDEIGTKIIFD